MTFSFTPSADSYPGSRQGRKTKVSDITLKASLKDGRGNDCAEQIEKVYGSDYTGSQTELQVGIKNTCKDPTVTLSLTDENGKVLDEKTFAIETQSKDKSSEKALIIFGIVILILLILYVVAGVVSKKKKDGVNISSFIFLFLFSTIFISGMLFCAQNTDAQTVQLELPLDDYYYGGGGDDGGDPTDPTDPPPTSTTSASFNINLNKASYIPEELMIVTSTFTYDSCDNVSANVKITGFINTPPQELFTLYDYTLLGGTAFTQSTNTNAPSMPGEYILVTNIYLSPVTYSATTSTSVELALNDSFVGLKGAISNYVNNNWSSINLTEFQVELGEVTTLFDLEELLADFGIDDIIITENKGDASLMATYELPFTVIGSTVNVTIMNDSGLYVDGPVLKSVGNNVNIKWISTNANSCSCKCVNPNNESEEISCGSNPLNPSDPPDCGTEMNIFDYKTIYNLVRDIKFKVTCSP